MSFLLGSKFDAVKFVPCTPIIAPAADQNLAGYTVITKYLPVFLRSSGTGVRLTLKGPVNIGNTVTISNVSISLAANSSTSDIYDSAASPTAVLFRASASVSLVRNGFAVSDETTFTIDRTQAVLIAYNVSSSGGGIVPFKSGFNQNSVVTYQRAATSEAATTNRTAGYTARSGTSSFLYLLETYT